MKLKTPLIAALIAGSPMTSSAFTLDAVGYEGFELSPNPVSAYIPGYGEVIFEAAVGTTLVVSSAYTNDNGFGGQTLSFDQNQAVRITFNGLPPEKDFFAHKAFLFTLQDSGDGTDLPTASLNTEGIPEPTSAVLGLIGTAGLVFRRRR